jgi:hypothetical protein
LLQRKSRFFTRKALSFSLLLEIGCDKGDNGDSRYDNR